MRVALVHLSRGVDGTPVSPLVDHLGLGILAAVLRRAGHEATILDTGPLSLDIAELPQMVLDCEPDLIGFSLNYVNIAESLALIRALRESIPHVPMTAGGLYATFHAEALLQRGVDLVVLGEGEQPLLRLAEQGKDRKAWSQISGLAWLENGTIRRTDPIPGLALDDLPDAARDTLPPFTNLPRGSFKVALEASRGCKHTCRFCSIAAAQRLDNTAGRRRTKSPELIAREIAAIVSQYGLRDFWFMDADFLGGRDELARQLAIAEAIGSLGQDITFEMDTRADGVTPEAIAALRQAGLDRVFLGVESFDQATLDLFAKGATVEGNRRAVDILEEAGVRPLLGTIMFHPKSTLAQLRRDHEALAAIGYEKTQMLFRLKKYRGSRDAGDLDCDGRGISFNEDYGWEFKDPVMGLAWNLFDRARLQLMDAVFNDLTKAFHRGEVDVPTFVRRSDRIFHSLGEFFSHMLEILERPNSTRLLPERGKLLEEIDKLVAAQLKAAGQ